MRWLALLVVVSLALVAAGCGGGSNDAAATTDTTTTAETMTTESTSTEETSTDTSASTTGATFDWTSKDCQNMVKAFLGLGAAVAAASGGKDVSSDVDQFGKYVDEVPDEIQADVKTIASAYNEFVAKIKDIGYKPGQVPTADQIQQLQDASQSMDDPAVRDASDRLSAWTKKNCT